MSKKNANKSAVSSNTDVASNATGFSIHDAAPIPATKRTKQSKYPWASLEIAKLDKETGFYVGPWFEVPGGYMKSILNTATGAARRLGRKFRVREVEGGVGVWRIE